MRVIDRTQYKIPTVKPTLNEKTLPNQGISSLEFSYDDSFIACKNGISIFR